MGRIWRTAPRVTLLGLVISWTILQSVTPEPTDFVPNFYDPKYHDDGRDETKVIEYNPVESSNVYTFQPSTSQQEYHDMNPSSDIHSGTGFKTVQEIPREPPKLSSQVNSFISNSFSKAVSNFKEVFNFQKPIQPIGIVKMHRLEPPSDYSGSGNVVWPESLSFSTSQDQTQTVSLTPSPPPTVSNSYNSVPLIHADPVYDHNTLSRYPLSEYPPSVPARPAEIIKIEGYKNGPYIPSPGFTVLNEHEPTVLKESNESHDYFETFDKGPNEAYKNQGPLSAFYQPSPSETPIKEERPKSEPISEYSDQIPNGYYSSQMSPPEHSRPPTSEYSVPSQDPYKYQGPSLISSILRPSTSGPHPESSNQYRLPLSSHYSKGPPQNYEVQAHDVKGFSSGPPPGLQYKPQAHYIKGFSSGPPPGLHNEDHDIKGFSSGPPPGLQYKPQAHYIRGFSSGPPPSSTYKPQAHDTKGFSNGPPPSLNYEPQDSFRPGKPDVTSSGYNYMEVPEYGGIPVRTATYSVSPVSSSSRYPSKPRSRPLSSFYDSGKLPDFGDGVTVTHTSYPPIEFPDFDLDDFMHFEKPSYTSTDFDSGFEEFIDDDPESSYVIKKPAYTPSYPYDEPEDEDLSGWSPVSPISSIYSSVRRPSYHRYPQLLTPGYSPGGWSNFGSYKAPKSPFDPHPSSYFSKGRKKVKYGTPYDLLQSPNYGNYYKNKYGGWERSPSPLKGYRYRYSTLNYPGNSPLNLPSQFDDENNPPEEHNYDCENRHSCNGQQSSLGISGSVDLTRRPKKRKFRNSLFKRLIRNLAGKRKPRRPPPKGRHCRGRRC